jgi:hypothetical protein
MVGSLIGLLITLLIVGVIYWAFMQLIGLIPLPAPIVQVVNVILVVIIALVIINALAGLLGAGTAFPTLHWR